MSRHLGSSPQAGGAAKSARRTLLGTLGALVVLGMLVGSAGFGQAAAHGLSTVAPGTAHLPAASNGDLVVASGQTVRIESPTPGSMYFQEGNITVMPGGTLLVVNTTLSFVQYVADGASLGQQFAHIYQFTDAGNVSFLHGGLTTDVNVLNFSAKLFVSVTGTLTAWNSTFDFPGWISVSGATAVATFNGSTLEANPALQNISVAQPPIEPAVISADTAYAPTINVTSGGQVNFFASHYDNSYANNLTKNGVPSVQPISATGLALPTTGATYPSSDFQLPPGSTTSQLTEDMLYASAASQVTVSITYDPVGTAGSATVSILYGGSAFPVGSAAFGAGGGTDTLVVGGSSSLVQAMMTTGLPLYTAGSVKFSAVTSSAVTISNLTINMTPAEQFNISASGAGSVVNSVDSSLDLNWAPSFLNGSTPIFPWDSNKLLVSNGAVAYLGNLTTPNGIPANASTSAVVTSGSGTAYLYRWGEFSVSGRNGTTRVEGATVSAFYAYTTLNNATANAANDLAVASPAIAKYLAYWDSVHGATSYGATNSLGLGWLLLASSQVTASSLPDGDFLGDYHIGIAVPAVGVAPQWFNWSVSPYPAGSAPGTPGYGLPDMAPAFIFEGYYGAVTLSTAAIYANGTVAAGATVRIGQLLGVSVTVTDAGTATVYAVYGALFYNNTTPLQNATFTGTGLHLTSPGQTYTFNLSWTINDTVTGLNGTFLHHFPVAVAWNGGVPSLAGGFAFENASVNIAPSQIRFVSFVAPTSPLNLNNLYYSTGELQFNGSKAAQIFVVATPVGGGSAVFLATATSPNGKFDFAWNGGNPLTGLGLTPGVTYQIVANATYNGVTTSHLLGDYLVPSTTSATSFLYQTFLGLPLWLWLVIAGAAVVAIAVVLLLFRRQAAGKLVECGECGELIPEDATVCPKCGAEFESDLVRCSRCSSTIPADSQYCPECSAQLLGKPGEGESDPERQAYADFTERFRAEGKKELGDNYTESAFWDWWKRQPTYVPFSQWKVQQNKGAPRAGMSQPPAGMETAADAELPSGRRPPSGGGSASGTAAAAAPGAGPGFTAPPLAAAAPVAASGGALKPCPNCGKEIPPEYLVCPFCGAVTQ